MGKKEAEVGKYLQTQIKDLGGFTRKWISPGAAGVPDQIVFLPGTLYFVEVKTTTGKPSKLQERELKRLGDFGFNAVCLYGKEGVDALIRRILHDYSTKVMRSRKAAERSGKKSSTPRIILPGGVNN